MSPATDERPRKTPYVVATGFTTACLGDERTLREFVVGDHVMNKILAKGENAVLYLINDSYDPLTPRQLRVGVNKDEKLFGQFEPYCGRPIAEIPDPFGCHQSYAQHFARALLRRLHALDIHPVLVNSYESYEKGHYAGFVSSTIASYHRIQEMLAARFPRYTMRNLFRPQCPKCRCIDATNVRAVEGLALRFDCDRCGTTTSEEFPAVRGKLSWKLDCAARWNLYGIDMETFSKSHIAELGTFEISRFMSLNFYGSKVPTIVKYGSVKIQRELSYKLLEILPPKIFKRLFVSNLGRDLELNRDSVESFCHKFAVRPGLSYVDYVRRELPHRALHENRPAGPDSGSQALPDTAISDDALVSFGNQFSRFYYSKDYGLRFPDSGTIASANQAAAQTARRWIQRALTIREGVTDTRKNAHALIKSFLLAEDSAPHVFQYLRRLFGQTEGPSITTLLSTLPREYLTTVTLLLAGYDGIVECAETWSAGSPNGSPIAPGAGAVAGLLSCVQELAASGVDADLASATDTASSSPSSPTPALPATSAPLR
jgi:lysyl-tRNA synthetase class I